MDGHGSGVIAGDGYQDGAGKTRATRNIGIIYIYPIGSMYGIYANIGVIWMVNVTIYSIHGSYGYGGFHGTPKWLVKKMENPNLKWKPAYIYIYILYYIISFIRISYPAFIPY